MENANANKVEDAIQQRLADYATGLRYEDFPAHVVHAAKVRVIDTLGALIAGFWGEPCRISRNLAAAMPNPAGATVIGTRFKTTVDMAAFVNATAARYAEMNDSYRWPGTLGGHPSDAVAPVLSAAEHAQADGKEFITAVVLAYEIHTRINDVFHNDAFHHVNFVCLSCAVAAGKLFGLSKSGLSHCISMAVVPNIILRQVRAGQLSMFKVVASGQASRAGVFAAMLARAGMEGPHLPFEGKAGWCEHVARERLTLGAMGGESAPFKILESRIKNRPANGSSIATILAAEKVAPLDIKGIRKITVEVSKRAIEHGAAGGEDWSPESRESADHSIPYNVAVTLMDGTVTLRSFDDSHLWNPELRALIRKIEVIEDTEFTRAFQRVPEEHRARVTVVTARGEQLVGESGGDQDDLSAPKSDAQIEDKFRGLTEDFLGARRVNSILGRLWHLEDMIGVEEIPKAFVLT